MTMQMAANQPEPGVSARHAATAMPVLLALSFAHLLNDLMQSLIPAIYPIIKQAYHLDFGQIGVITLTFQLAASVFQPLVGLYTDRRPLPFSTVVGMGFTFGPLLGLVAHLRQRGRSARQSHRERPLSARLYLQDRDRARRARWRSAEARGAPPLHGLPRARRPHLQLLEALRARLERPGAGDR